MTEKSQIPKVRHKLRHSPQKTNGSNGSNRVREEIKEAVSEIGSTSPAEEKTEIERKEGGR